MFLKSCIFVILATVASSHCRFVENVELQEDTKSLDYSDFSLHDLGDLIKFIHRSCLKDLSTDAEEYQTFKNANAELDDCMDCVFNKTRLNQFFDADKYCPRFSGSVKCMEVFGEEMSRCMPTKDLHTEMDLLKNILSSIIDGMCSKDGDGYKLSNLQPAPNNLLTYVSSNLHYPTHLAACACSSNEPTPQNPEQKMDETFYDITWLIDIPDEYNTEGGHKCILAKKTQLKECSDQHDKYMGGLSIQERCDNISALQQCIVRELKTCETTSAADFFESFYNYMEKKVPCKMDIGKGAALNALSEKYKLEVIRSQVSGFFAK